MKSAHVPQPVEKKDREGPGKPLCMVIEEGQNYKLAISGGMPKCAKIFPGHICAFLG